MSEGGRGQLRCPQNRGSHPGGAGTSRGGWGGRLLVAPSAAASAGAEGFLLAAVRLEAEAEAQAGLEGAGGSLGLLRDTAVTELHRERVE